MRFRLRTLFLVTTFVAVFIPISTRLTVSMQWAPHGPYHTSYIWLAWWIRDDNPANEMKGNHFTLFEICYDEVLANEYPEAKGPWRLTVFDRMIIDEAGLFKSTAPYKAQIDRVRTWTNYIPK